MLLTHFRREREKAGWTQEATAERLEMTLQEYQELEQEEALTESVFSLLKNDPELNALFEKRLRELLELNEQLSAP